MVPMSYAIGHSVMWCTIWACTYLDDLSFACVGFFIILFIFLAFGIAAPLPYEVIGHGLLFVDIAIANTFLHYPDYVMMFLLGIPLYIGICVFDVAMEKTYRDQVALKLKLEDHLRHDELTGAYNRNVFESLVGENHTFICAKGEYMAIATSIDALAVGVTFAFLDANVWVAITFIGVITFIMSAIGIKIGNIFGEGLLKGLRFKPFSIKMLIYK